MGLSVDILRERCEGKAAADCSASALPLLETFLASVRNSSNAIKTTMELQCNDFWNEIKAFNPNKESLPQTERGTSMKSNH